MEKIIEWLKVNKTLAIAASVALVLIPKIFKPTRRKRRTTRPVSSPRSRKQNVSVSRRRKTYRPGKKQKKAWQVKGSIAARRHMARIRKLRR